MTRKAVVFKKNTKNKLERCGGGKESISETITRLTETYGQELLQNAKSNQ